MEWAMKRKILYVSALVGVVLLIGAYPMYRALFPSGTCFDNKQNGGEAGVDCGGACTLYCTSQVKPLRVVWAEAFSFAPDHYDVGAYIENPNIDAGIKSARYTVRIFDATGQTIGERIGAIEISPRAPTFLFEGNFTLLTPPAKVEVVFDDAYLESMVSARPSAPVLVTKNQRLKEVTTSPRFDAVLVNTDPLNSVSSVSLGAIIFDSARNPIAISRTIVEEIEKGEEQQIFFTWPNRFLGVEEGERLITDIIIMTPAVFEK
ncbi:MAG: hypothetical protein A3B07_01045 [Candidatus Yonathbacteria bacterium RIFCSPLOWO2_01_FULL_43_27]|uniref:Uncharacterized protein n=1 Tax=Candidatus Yonathbacteria bacterium RIFCSPLOWO2_01_FULL_43_27 TaxID=1802726 RepID=A0A1G2SCE7_9BACT|nr:MAG: hypothetical protein A3B07_01045 [Candidatus Yonathbacteria bacterium RIFCSPLOWO2_01_FULL_43_27]